jgi:hypothetical protein
LLQTHLEADILAQVVEPDRPDLPPDTAKAILSLRFNRAAVRRMNKLADKNRRGALRDAERAELERYVRVGDFLNLLHAKARVSLHNALFSKR